jgi:hypothetical protein
MKQILQMWKHPEDLYVEEEEDCYEVACVWVEE